MSASTVGQKGTTAAMLRKEIKKLDPELKEDDEAHAAAMVVLGLLCGPEFWKPRALARLTGVPERKVGGYLTKLRESGVIRRGKLYIDWDDPQTGGIAFWMDVNVALGFMARVAPGSEA